MGLLTNKATPVLATPEKLGLDHFFSDEAATNALANAESDPEAAKDALLIAADYINRGVPLPGILANYIAKAIEAAMAKPKKLRAKALTDELRLSAVNRRPKADWLSIGADVELHISKGASQDRALLDVSVKYRVSKSTAERYWNEYRPRSLAFQADVEKRLLSQKPPTL